LPLTYRYVGNFYYISEPEIKYFCALYVSAETVSKEKGFSAASVHVGGRCSDL